MIELCRFVPLSSCKAERLVDALYRGRLLPVTVIVIGVDDLAEGVGEEADRAEMVGVIAVARVKGAGRVKRLKL